jgi:hypothetical protein
MVYKTYIVYDLVSFHWGRLKILVFLLVEQQHENFENSLLLFFQALPISEREIDR